MSDDLNEFGTLVPKRLAEALVKENALLKAEVERLRKAGDAMAEGLLKYIEPTDGYLTYLDCRANWTAAKEGKPSV
jgi:hypothetical protein